MKAANWRENEKCDQKWRVWCHAAPKSTRWVVVFLTRGHPRVRPTLSEGLRCSFRPLKMLGLLPEAAGGSESGLWFPPQVVVVQTPPDSRFRHLSSPAVSQVSRTPAAAPRRCRRTAQNHLTALRARYLRTRLEDVQCGDESQSDRLHI